ncbi:hypothetical protein V1503_18750 [Bacillus sp. SCS-151]|uniref:hypothetical protein n=1 Tax=Nanhaiella sioensis TaxID=3115293 RepID=UPI00397863E2
MRKNYFALIATVFLLILSPSISSAHTSGPDGSESEGWVLKLNGHAGTSLDSFSLNPKITIGGSLYNEILGGAAKWDSSDVSFYHNSSGNGVGYISTFTQPDSDTIAQFYGRDTNSQGHYIRWTMDINVPRYNDYDTADRKIILAHEFGHAVGLKDLRDTSNNDKLMYGTTKEWDWPSYPTPADKTGAKEASK